MSCWPVPNGRKEAGNRSISSHSSFLAESDWVLWSSATDPETLVIVHRDLVSDFQLFDCQLARTSECRIQPEQLLKRAQAEAPP
jgi:hypothetical protein